MVNEMSRTLKQSRVPHRGGIYGRPRHCKDVFSEHVGSLPGGQGRIYQKTIPGMIIDARDLARPTQGAGRSYWENAASLTTRCSREGAAEAPTSLHPSNKQLQSTDANNAERTTT